MGAHPDGHLVWPAAGLVQCCDGIPQGFLNKRQFHKPLSDALGCPDADQVFIACPETCLLYTSDAADE